jgi:ABC-type branched-subunit amino acid transport system substrate-binding protein
MEHYLLSIRRHGLNIITELCIAVCIVGCSKVAIGNSSIGVLTGDFTGSDTKAADALAMEQQTGFLLGLKDGTNGFKLVQKNEGDQEDDVQTAIRDMVEEDQIVALLGGTSNEATMRSASLTNFFNVPMVIPNADGENVIPSNNLWVFRLSAPSSAYGKYIFSDIIPKSNPASAENNGDDSSTSQSGIVKLAIIYEKNTFGENAAVETAQIALDQSVKVVYYESFTTGSDNADEIIALAHNVNQSGANLVYVISDITSEALSVSSALIDSFGSGLAPIILGQGSGFDSQEFLASGKVNGVYVIRQAIDSTDCPTDVDTIAKARSYASIFLLEEAITQANKDLFSTGWISNLKDRNTDLLGSRREKIRDTLKQTDTTLPCLGHVSFDNTGVNKSFSFEIIQAEKGKTTIINADQLKTVIEQLIAKDQLTIIE